VDDTQFVEYPQKGMAMSDENDVQWTQTRVDKDTLERIRRIAARNRRTVPLQLAYWADRDEAEEARRKATFEQQTTQS
jgi:hypothetical protein